MSTIVLHSHISCYGTKTALMNEKELFFQSESLGTIVEPKCGGCKCNKCPIPGSKYCFKEQKEYDLIQKNLFYDKEKKRWMTEYPWSCDRSVLPKNDKIALRSLLSLERNLSKNQDRANAYCKQIDEMVERGVAVILTPEQLENWQGDYYYLPIVGVVQKKATFSLRVCFDASRQQGGFSSLKDCFLNSLFIGDPWIHKW